MIVAGMWVAQTCIRFANWPESCGWSFFTGPMVCSQHCDCTSSEELLTVVLRFWQFTMSWGGKVFAFYFKEYFWATDELFCSGFGYGVFGLEERGRKWRERKWFSQKSQFLISYTMYVLVLLNLEALTPAVLYSSYQPVKAVSLSGWASLKMLFWAFFWRLFQSLPALQFEFKNAQLDVYMSIMKLGFSNEHEVLLIKQVTADGGCSPKATLSCWLFKCRALNT